MIFVRYYWSEDGAGEICTYEEFTTGMDVRCDHCDNLIKEGKTAVMLCNDENMYVLHMACAKASITPLRVKTDKGG